jgi:hypothetical protein
MFSSTSSHQICFLSKSSGWPNQPAKLGVLLQLSLEEQAQTDLLSDQAAWLKLGLQQVQDHVEAVYETLSWQITAPLRKLRG